MAIDTERLSIPCWPASGPMQTMCETPTIVMTATPSFSGADERCDGEDNDCDGLVDDDDDAVFEAIVWTIDADGDGHGNLESDAPQLIQCAQPEGYVVSTSDCNDSDPEIYPLAAEVCNTQDDDCDGQIDEDVEQLFLCGCRW